MASTQCSCGLEFAVMPSQDVYPNSDVICNGCRETIEVDVTTYHCTHDGGYDLCQECYNKSLTQEAEEEEVEEEVEEKEPEEVEVVVATEEKLKPTMNPAAIAAAQTHGTRRANCPGLHGLTEYRVVMDGIFCIVCNTPFKDHAVVYGCRACDYDVCAACYAPDLVIAEQTDTQTQQTEEVALMTAPKTIRQSSEDDRRAQMYGPLNYNPGDWVWKYWHEDPKTESGNFKEAANYVDDDGKEILLNVPQLQYKYHFLGEINEDTYVQFINTYTDHGGEYCALPPPLCAMPTKLRDCPPVWNLVKFPPKTWEVIKNDLSAWAQFEEMDVNEDGIISEEEFRAFWEEKGLLDEVIEKRIKKLRKADKNGDMMISFNEFKGAFHSLNLKFWNDDFKVRMSQWLYVIVLPILALIILSISGGEIHISVLIGISIQVMYMIYFATLGYYFWKGSSIADNVKDTTYLYRVFSRPGKAVIREGKWAPLSMTINQVAWPLKCVHSVSEFSAVDGAIPSIMLSNIGQYTWAMITMHFMIQIAYNDDFRWNFSDLCQIVGVAGLVMLGVFEADPYNPSVNKGHMVGAFCGFGTVVGYITQQLEISGQVTGEQGVRQSLSWLLAIIFVVFYTLWNVVLSLCYFQEAKAWGIYDKKEKEEDDGEWTWWATIILCCCTFFCIILAIPLLAILCCAPFWIYKRHKHHKSVKARDDVLAQDIYDFQPALPNWPEFVTKKTKRTITSFSIANVMFEGIVLLVGSTALSLWLMGYDTACHGACPEEVFMFLFLIMVLGFGLFGVYSLFGIFNNAKFGDGALDALLNIDQE